MTRSGLFKKYAVLITALITGALVVSGITSLYFSYREIHEHLIALQHEKAAAAAGRIEQYVLEIQHQLGWTAFRPLEVDSNPLDLRRYEYQKLLKQAPAVTEVAWLDPSGREQLRVSRLAMDVAGAGTDFSAAPYFREIKPGKTWYGPVYFKRQTEPYMTIARPAGGDSGGVTVAEINLKFVWDVVSKIQIGKAGVAYVADSLGTLVAHPDRFLVLQKTDLSPLTQFKALQEGQVGPSIATNIKGEHVLTADARISTLNWIVFVDVPLTEAYAPLYASLLRTALLLLAGLAISIVASLYLARRMVTPIRALADGVTQITAGQLRQRVEVNTGDELEMLAERFNNMAAQLDELYASLERKVEERTRELTDSLEQQTATGEILRVISSSHTDLQPVFDAILEKATRLCDAHLGLLGLYDGEKFLTVAHRGANAEFSKWLMDRGAYIPPPPGSIARMIAERQPVQVADFMESPSYRAGSPITVSMVELGGVRTYLAVPMLKEGRVVGGITIYRPEVRPFTQKQIDLVSTFASQAVIAIENVRLFKEIQDKTRQLEAASQHKSQFLANMSHELRTPMNAIIGITEMLLEDARDLKRDDEMEPLERILRAAQQLLALINDILDLSKIEAGKMDLHLQEFAIAPLVEDVAATVRPMAEKNGNRVNVECMPDLGIMHADLTRVRQALLNLASNAVKFTEKGTVTISATRETADAGDTIALHVTDTGIGMTAEQTSRLFQDFSQADASTTRKYGGTGLGLAISRRFCRMMGGDIIVESTLGRGSTFTICLPAAGVVAGTDKPAAEQAFAAPPSTPALRGRDAATVLVVDDDPTVRGLMERYLTREGYAVITAENGIEGLARAREIHPCAITLDVMMPDIDGWTVLAALKGDPSLADIPVILVTIVDEKQRGYTLGATDYLIKPVDRERLTAVLRSLCGRSAGRLLLVEDDDTARALIRPAVEREGWEVVEATNGRVALERLKEARPDAIILDLMMPEMDGFEFLAELRKRAEWRHIPVVVVTAKDLTEEDHRRLNGEVERILQKDAPTRDDMLREVSATLTGCIERGRARQAAGERT